jgi:hypothetical protein
MIRTALLLSACLLLSTKVLAADPAIPVASPGDFTWRGVQAMPPRPDCEGISETFNAAMSALLDVPQLGQVRDGSRRDATRRTLSRRALDIGALPAVGGRGTLPARRQSHVAQANGGRSGRNAEVVRKGHGCTQPSRQ